MKPLYSYSWYLTASGQCPWASWAAVYLTHSVHDLGFSSTSLQAAALVCLAEVGVCVQPQRRNMLEVQNGCYLWDLTGQTRGLDNSWHQGVMTRHVSVRWQHLLLDASSHHEWFEP